VDRKDMGLRNTRALRLSMAARTIADMVKTRNKETVERDAEDSTIRAETGREKTFSGEKMRNEEN